MDPSEAESALDSAELKAMLADQKTLLSAMGGFVSEIMDLKTDETDPRKLLKLLILDAGRYFSCHFLLAVVVSVRFPVVKVRHFHV